MDTKSEIALFLWHPFCKPAVTYTTQWLQYLCIVIDKRLKSFTVSVLQQNMHISKAAGV